MTATGMPEIASDADVDGTIRYVTDNTPKAFLWDYERSRPQLVTLYNKAMSSQWSSVTELDWSTPVDPERLIDWDAPVMVLAKAAKDLPGSPIASWGDREFTQLGLESLKAQLSQFVHGEQGAMLTAAKIVETVPWIDAKYYAATQTMDEARHTEVFQRYLSEKVGDAYPMGPYLQGQVFGLLEDSRWDIAYLGMQIVIESLALAAFGEMLRRTEEPLLRKLLRYVLADEARHVAFGILSLGEVYQHMSEPELKERQEFLAENTLRNRLRSTTPEMWDRLGVDIDVVLPFLMEAAGKIGLDPTAGFQRAFFSKLVPNVRKLGLLDANDGYLRRLWGDAGLLEYEFDDDTGVRLRARTTPSPRTAPPPPPPTDLGGIRIRAGIVSESETIPAQMPMCYESRPDGEQGPARDVPAQAGLLGHQRAVRRRHGDPATGGRPALRRPAPPSHPAALRPAARSGRRAAELGGPEGPDARPRCPADGHPRRGPPARLLRLRGRDPGRRVRRR